MKSKGKGNRGGNTAPVFMGNHDISIATAGLSKFTDELTKLRNALGEAAGVFSKFQQQYLPQMDLTPDATTWVARDKEGNKHRVKVAEMEDTHLWRWIRYFRRKYRDGGFAGTDDQLDTLIQMDMVTGPAIYAEAMRRGVIKGVKVVGQPEASVVEQEELPPGTRRITLEDE